jgi:hypothetical protein
LVIGGPVVGAFERFRLTSEGLLYSSAMGGFFQCSSTSVEMVKGYSFSYSSYSNKVYFEPIPVETVVRARELVDLSGQVQQIQQTSLNAHKAVYAQEQSKKEQEKMKLMAGNSTKGMDLGVNLIIVNS